jgi:hypothetical protein
MNAPTHVVILAGSKAWTIWRLSPANLTAFALLADCPTACEDQQERVIPDVELVGPPATMINKPMKG